MPGYHTPKIPPEKGKHTRDKNKPVCAALPQRYRKGPLDDRSFSLCLSLFVILSGFFFFFPSCLLCFQFPNV